MNVNASFHHPFKIVKLKIQVRYIYKKNFLKVQKTKLIIQKTESANEMFI